MKLIITGDWQLDAAPAHDQVDPKTNRSTRFAETVETIQGVIDAGLAAGAEGLLHLGDLTENKNPKALELEAAADLFTRAMSGGRRVWAVAGNHDGSLFEVSSSSFSPLARMRTDSFKLFHKVAVDTELGMLAIPYIHRATPEEVRTQIRMTSGIEIPTFAAIHYGVIGTGGPCAVGPRNLVIAGTDYLGAETFQDCPGINAVFAGHIHKAQTLELRPGCQAYLPGSPVICDMGEREDPKTWILFDTVTRDVKINFIPQRRRWISVPYYPEIADCAWTKDDTAAPWAPDDIVKITGTYTKPDYPKDTLETAFKAGLVRPFSLEFSVTQAKTEKAARLEISAEGGLRQALQTYVKEKFPNNSQTPGQVGPATALAMDVLREQGLQTRHPQVDATGIEVHNFATIKDFHGDFRQGTPTLITGRNGIGKTNFMDAPLWCLTGKTSKGLGLAGVVRQNTTDTSVTMYMDGHGGEQASTRYRVTRAVKLSKAGKPTQKLSLEKLGLVEWEQLGDGGIEETQNAINGLIGGGYTSLRTTNFRFQNDTSPFVRANPADRKAVIGEITGLEPLGKAFKVLDAKRLESQRAHLDAKQRLTGMLALGEGSEERLKAAQAALETARLELLTQEAAAPAAQVQADAGALAQVKAQAAVTATQGQIDALPNTAAVLSGAEQAVATYESTYAASRAAKVTRFRELQAKIVATEAELKALAAPDPAMVAELEAKVSASEKELADLQAKQSTAATVDATAGAQLTGATAAVKATADELAPAVAALGALPPKSTEDLEAALAGAETALGAVDAKVQDLAGQSIRLSGAISAAVAEIKKLETERASFSGSDIGACSRCGQKVDSSHAEKELARIAGELTTAVALKTSEGEALGRVTADMGTAALAQLQAKQAVRTLMDKKQAAALAEQSRVTLVQKVADLQAKAITLQVASDALIATKAATASGLQALTPLVDEAKRAFQSLSEQLRALREVGTKLGILTGKLEAERAGLAEVTAQGEKETAAYEAEVVRLKGEVDKARVAHITNDAMVQALRIQLQGLASAATAAGTALVEALTLANTVKAAIVSAKQRTKDLEEQIKAIEGQRQALETATFELATLQERADIDALACGLLDPKQGLPVFLIDGALPFLEDRINLYMEQLGMDRLTVELTTLEEDKETLAVLVDNGRPGPRLDISAFSGGQLDRVEYALKCALADLQRQTRGVTLGLVCYDEPTGGLDEAGKQGLINLLYERSATYPVSLVVSHDEALIRSFDHRLQFSQGPEEETLVAAA